VRLVQRRIGFLFALFLLALLAIVGRATWLGTVQAGDLKSRAVAQQVDELRVPARRGTITDRNGVELAVSEDAVTVFANPFLIRNPTRVAAKVAPLIGRPYEEVVDKLADRDRGYVYLRRKLDGWRSEAVQKLKIEGLGTVIEPKRRYPQGSLASQVLGTVGTDNLGLAGLEQSQEERLHGTDGRRRVVKDALGKPINIVEVKRAEAGQDLRLTIDSAIQERVEAILGQVGQTYRPKGATALVMDPRNGELLALANWPRVNANDIGSAPPFARQNRAVAAAYEPGSTFKAFTVSGALEEKLITPETPFGLPGTIQVADRTIKESHDQTYGTLTVADILAKSSNVGTVKIGLELGRRRFDRWIRRFGFGAPTKIDLPGEQSGIVLKPEQYSGSSLGNLPIGQGIAVTPMQMAAAYQAIATGGVLRRPHVVIGDPAPARRVLSPQTAQEVSHMLEGVLGPGGTAEEASVEGYKLAGKTGTAQKPDPKYGGYSKTKYFASFIGFAPARKPRLLVAVMVDEPQGQIYGGVVAAPAFEKIVSFALPYLRIPPE
jgi:cell division protein FtsI (penicillin-binding protein 3)